MCKGKAVLAERDNFGLVAECGCGTVHVTVGPVSVALDVEALRKMHEMLGEALSRLDSISTELAQPQPLLMHSSHLAMKKVLKIKH